MAEDALAAMRAKISQPKVRAKKAIWVAPEVEDFGYEGEVLAFDQTLTKTGWSVVDHDDEGLWVLEGGVLVPDVGDLIGFEQTFAKAAALGVLIEEVVAANPGVSAIVHEMPAVQGYRIESSLMAAREVRRAARRPVTMLGRASAYSLLTGAAYSEKVRMTEAVNRLIPRDHRSTRRWTQDVHDSVGLALTYLHRKAHP